MNHDTTAIYSYDVVIVGAGIAGIALAEFLSRKSALKIKVIDKAPLLGTEASGKLEGWFHTGALYSGNDDPSVFMNCVNAIQDLITFYSTYFNGKCNLELAEKKPDFFVPTVQDSGNENQWFKDSPVYLILPNGQSPEIKLSHLKSDPVLWEIQRQRVMNRLEATFGLQQSWVKNGKCTAPTYAEIERYGSGTCTLLAQSEILQEFCKRHDATFGVLNSRYDIIKSCDVSMNTTAILRDLISSAIANGVNFETGVTIESFFLEPTHLKSILCRSQEGLKKHLKASLFIFAVGAGFEALLKENFKSSLKLMVNESAMVLASPSFCSTNFVRMSPKPKFHFNHFAHHAEGPMGRLDYSILANSRFSREDADSQQSDTDSLLDAAEKYFGKHEVYSRNLYSYKCLKTEFVSTEDEKRRYSYWIELHKNSNCMFLLPGKFSFFPTTAYQAYLKIKNFFNLLNPPDRVYVPNEQNDKLAKELLADHQAVRILSKSIPSPNYLAV